MVIHQKALLKSFKHLTKEKLLAKPITELVEKTWEYGREGLDEKLLNHRGLKVKQVFRIDNESLMQEYSAEKKKTLHMNNPFFLQELRIRPLLTTRVLTRQRNRYDPEMAEEHLLSLGPNEAYLFYGTKLEHVKHIEENGFDSSKSKDGVYGKAINLAESSEWAHKYAGKYCL